MVQAARRAANRSGTSRNANAVAASSSNATCSMPSTLPESGRATREVAEMHRASTCRGYLAQAPARRRSARRRATNRTRGPRTSPSALFSRQARSTLWREILAPFRIAGGRAHDARHRLLQRSHRIVQRCRRITHFAPHIGHSARPRQRHRRPARSWHPPPSSSVPRCG